MPANLTSALFSLAANQKHLQLLDVESVFIYHACYIKSNFSSRLNYVFILTTDSTTNFQSGKSNHYFPPAFNEYPHIQTSSSIFTSLLLENFISIPYLRFLHPSHESCKMLVSSRRLLRTSGYQSPYRTPFLLGFLYIYNGGDHTASHLVPRI